MAGRGAVDSLRGVPDVPTATVIVVSEDGPVSVVRKGLVLGSSSAG
jgi:hypothetical protein